MKRYTTDELDGEWEFKIVRSELGAFRKPENFQRLQEEEAVAGWQLVEKLDNNRVRFKRLASSRNNDMMLPRGIDPYRTQFGSVNPAVWVAVGTAIAVLVGVLVFFLVGSDSGEINLSGAPTVIAPMIAVIIGIVFVIFVVMRKRS